MGQKFDLTQIGGVRAAWIGLLNFAGSGSANNVTSALTTALATAGDNGVSVPLQVASGEQVGLITASPNNFCRIVQTSTRTPISDGSGNEIYGRLTQNSGVYTLTYFSLVSGTETAYSFGSATNINFFVGYRFDQVRFPKDAAIAIAAQIVQDDPIQNVAAGTTLGVPVQLTVSMLNTLPNLPSAPSAANRVILYVNGKTEFSTGSAPAFSHSGVSLTWNAANAGYSIDPARSPEVYALVW